MEAIKTSGGLAGLLGPSPKSVGRGRKKIKAENPSGPLLVVPYPILASGADQSPVSITAKEGKTYRYRCIAFLFVLVHLKTKFLLLFTLVCWSRQKSGSPNVVFSPADVKFAR